MGFFLRHKVAILAIVILLISMFSIYTPEPGDNGIGHRAIMVIASPIQHVVVAISDGLSNVWNGYFALVDAKQEAKEANDVNRYLGLQLKMLQEIERENVRLRKLLNFKTRENLHIVPGRVIATDILGQFRTVTLNVGADNGVRVNFPVVNADGVIGRVIEVYSGSSKVLLMIDPHSSIDGRVVRTNAQGMIKGTKNNDNMLCEFAFSLRIEDVRMGDRVITSGLGQQFPQGLVLGDVIEVSRSDVGIFQEARIRPAVDFTRLQEVMVVLPGGEKP